MTRSFRLFRALAAFELQRERNPEKFFKIKRKCAGLRAVRIRRCSRLPAENEFLRTLESAVISFCRSTNLPAAFL
jgi:hypothetical protein